VYTRAPLYFLTLVATITFIVFPLTGRSDPLGERINAFKWVSDGIRALAGVLPSWVSQWLISYAQYPLTFLTLGGLILILLFSGRRVASAINDRMMTLWRESFAGTLAVPATTPNEAAPQTDEA
jgi:hypothetical protein